MFSALGLKVSNAFNKKADYGYSIRLYRPTKSDRFRSNLAKADIDPAAANSPFVRSADLHCHILNGSFFAVSVNIIPLRGSEAPKRAHSLH